MRNNPDDLANQMLQKVKYYLQGEVDNTELDEDIMVSAEDGILVGRKELAESLLLQMEKWENEDDKGH